MSDERPARWPAALAIVVVLAAVMAWGPWFLLGLPAILLVPALRRSLRAWRWWRVIGAWVLVAAALTLLVIVIPDGRLPIPQGPGLLVGPSYVGKPATPQPIGLVAIPDSPAMAPAGRNSMHNDAWATDAYTWAGPLGKDPEVDTAWYGIEECATLAFDSHDRMIALCGDIKGPVMHVLDTETMRALATRRLPERKPSAEGKKPWEDLCGGAYFYLDQDDRAVVATTDQRVLVLTTSDADDKPELRQAESFDLDEQIPDKDCLIALMPDWSGRVWWVTQRGLVGALDTGSGTSQVFDTHEQIANSLAADENGGIYVVTVQGFYRFVADGQGKPTVAWRASYDRGSRQKPGQLSQGSGTTPTVLPGDLVAITDNADPRMNVVFYRRSTGAEVCKAPVFANDRSASDNSLVVVGPSSVVVENNYGYSSPLSAMLGRRTTPGFARVDADGGTCKVAWTSKENGPTSVAKSSLETGLVYAYTKRPSRLGVDTWYLTAIDARTGRTAFSVRTGTGALMNNHYAAVTLAPDGAAFIATPAGMVRVRDRR